MGKPGAVHRDSRQNQYTGRGDAGPCAMAARFIDTARAILLAGCMDGTGPRVVMSHTWPEFGPVCRRTCAGMRLHDLVQGVEDKRLDVVSVIEVDHQQADR